MDIINMTVEDVMQGLKDGSITQKEVNDAVEAISHGESVEEEIER